MARRREIVLNFTAQDQSIFFFFSINKPAFKPENIDKKISTNAYGTKVTNNKHKSDHDAEMRLDSDTTIGVYAWIVILVIFGNT